MTTPFWGNEPTILFKKEFIMEVWPTTDMSFEQKLNAITRIVIILTCLAFLLTKNISFIVILFITLAIIYSMYIFRKQKIVNSMIKRKEGFSVNPSMQPSALSPAPTTTNPVNLDVVLKANFHPTTKQNPMGNVLLTEIMDDPNRKAAAPSFNPDVNEDINNATKKQTQMLNPTIINTNKQLYGDLYDNYQFDRQMMQRFYTTANSRVTNDQGAYQNYLYGSMYSAKEDSPSGAMMRVKDSFRYLLI
jgi:Ca2+/Na+ antiporter